MHTATTIWNLIALGLLKQAGMKVPDATVEKGFGFLKSKYFDAQKKPGYLLYGDAAPETGTTNRAASMMWALEVHGRQGGMWWKESQTFYRKSMTRKFIYGGHSPAYQHLMSGVAAHRLGGEDWETYVERMEDPILKRLKKDRWLFDEGKLDKAHPHGGTIFETALMSLILQLPGSNISVLQRKADN